MNESRQEAVGRVLQPRALVEQIPEPELIAIAAGITIVLLGIAGIAVGTDAYQGEGSVWDRLFNLVNEKTIPTFFSGAILIAGGLCSLLAARCRLYGTRNIWIAFGALLLLMAADEVVQIHERIETWTGVDWQQPYAVVAVGAAVIWFQILRRMDRLQRAMMVVGALCWLFSFGLEDAQYDSQDHRVSGFAAMAISEELLEMAGSTLFLLALVVALKQMQAQRTSYA